MINPTQPYINLNTQFNNPTLAADVRSDQTSGKESRRKKEETDSGALKIY